MTPEEILAAVRDALRKGADPGDVNAWLAENTGGDFQSVEQLQASIRPGPTRAAHQAGLLDAAPLPDEEEQREAARERLRDVRGEGTAGTVLDYVRLAEQGATLGLGDEIAGILGAAPRLVPGGESPGEAYRRITDRSRQWVEDARTVHGIPAHAAEIVGGLGTGLAGLARMGVGEAGAQVLPRVLSSGSAGRAAAVGAAEGGVAGFGYSEGNPLERLPGTAFGAAAGGLLSGGASLAGTALRRMPKVTEVTDQLTSRLGIGRFGEIAPLEEKAAQNLQRVRAQFYEPLEQEFAEIADSEILALLRGDKYGEEIAGPMREAVRKVLGRDAMESAESVSYQQLQSIRSRLSSIAERANRAGDVAEAQAARQARGTLSSVMDRRIPGSAAADAAYSRAKNVQEAFQLGQRAQGFGSKRNRAEQMAEAQQQIAADDDYLAQLLAGDEGGMTNEQVRQAMAGLTSDEARIAFRQGQGAVVSDMLLKGGDYLSESQIEKLLSPAVRERFRVLLPRAQDYDAVVGVIERTGNVLKARQNLRKILRSIGLAGGTIGGGYVGGRATGLFD